MSEQKFLHAYGNFLVQSWASPPLRNRFRAEPALILKEFGLDPEGVKINILPPGERGPNTAPESEVVLWNEGKKSGTIDFYYPEQPPEGVANMELTDEQLEAIAGGWSISCCCCTPVAPVSP
jgi:hypothetical protein